MITTIHSPTSPFAHMIPSLQKTSRLLPVLLTLLLTMGLQLGCDSFSGDSSSDESSQASKKKSASEKIIDRLQGTWVIDVEQTLGDPNQKKLTQSERQIATTLFKKLELTINGTDATISAKAFGKEQSQDWKLNIESIIEKGANPTFELCITKQKKDTRECNPAQLTDTTFIAESADGFITHYIPKPSSPEE